MVQRRCCRCAPSTSARRRRGGEWAEESRVRCSTEFEGEGGRKLRALRKSLVSMSKWNSSQPCYSTRTEQSIQRFSQIFCASERTSRPQSNCRSWVGVWTLSRKEPIMNRRSALKSAVFDATALRPRVNTSAPDGQSPRPTQGKTNIVFVLADDRYDVSHVLAHTNEHHDEQVSRRVRVTHQ